MKVFVNTTQTHKRIGVAVISDNQGQILIDRRLPTGVMAGLWEFPGGKIEAKETVSACIFREIKEELGVEVMVGTHLILRSRLTVQEIYR